MSIKNTRFSHINSLQIGLICPIFFSMNAHMVRRENRKHVVMSDEELAIIEAAATRRGIGVTTFLRQAALEVARKDRNDE